MIGWLLDRLAARQRQAAGTTTLEKTISGRKQTVRAAIDRQRTALDTVTYGGLNRVAFGRDAWPRDERGTRDRE